jgi:hypothetical protein
MNIMPKIIAVATNIVTDGKMPPKPIIPNPINRQFAPTKN